jgi:eukaryotic-like serine/threonine-protein kinase
VAKLVVKSGKGVGQEYSLNGERLIMGRRSALPIPMADPKASREHAVIFRKDKEYFLQDLSRNGTLLNGRLCSKTSEGSLLKFGDIIKIGDTEMEIVDEKNEPITLEVPGYKIIERCGSGGMGTVYKAKQLSMDRIVALKVLNERYSSNSEFVDRFIREARAAGKLNHPNVIHVHDISRANGRHYFSMEFVDGQSAKELLKAEKKLDVTKALDIVLQCAKALEFAHENGIVHRDVKPDNIMLTKEGIVKIADLGIAKTFEESAPSAKEHRRVMGTPHYMAPEQALGKAIDLRVDIYSLGATFYHMITGTTPYAGSTAHQILKAHIQESLPPIQALNPNIPDPVCFIIERMMAKLPEKRYPDMGRLIADIERVQRGNVDGIDRIEAGDSTVLRAIAEKAKKDASNDDTDEPEHDDEAPTGAQKSIPKPVLMVGLCVIFVVVVAAVVILAQKYKPQPEGRSEGSGGATMNNGGKETADPKVSRSNPEAKKLLEAAIAAEAANNPSEYEQNLKSIKQQFPASEEAIEAKRRLDAWATAARDEEKKNAEKLLNEAKAFEAANANNMPDVIKKYRAAMDASKNVVEVFDVAKNSVENLQKKLDQEQAKATDAAYRAALETAAGQRTKFDYDGARTALQDFMAKFANAPQKADAETALTKLNDEAKAKLKEVQDLTANMDVAPALAEWDRYLAQVKDAVAANDAAAAKQAQIAKADGIAQDELTRAADKAKKFDYIEALNITRALHKRLVGVAKFDPILKDREESLIKQKNLYSKYQTLAGEKLKSGPLQLSFPLETKFGAVNWKVARVSGEQVSLDAVPTNAAPGIMKRLYELTPKEQLQFVLMMISKDAKDMKELKELTVDDFKGLTAFCIERGLTDEAGEYEKRTNPQAPPP